MDLTRCGAWRPLALVFGLIVSPSVFAQWNGDFQTQQEASLVCGIAEASWLSRGFYSGSAPNGREACLISSCSLDVSSKRYFLTLGFRQLGAGVTECTQNSDPTSYFEDNSIEFSGKSPNQFQSARFFFSYLEDDPAPECPDYTAPEFTGWKAPTPNGSGTICLNGCVAEIALSPPPGPLYLGQWTGATCSVDNALPAETPELPEDPEAPGTDDPSDPNAPDGTGGGGFTCDAPPVCKADGITCSALYQQWRTRCDAQNSDLEAGEQRDAIIDGLGQIGDGVDGLGSGIDRIGDGIDGLGNSLDGVNDRLDGTNNRLDGTNQRLDGIGGKLDGIGDGIDGLGSKFGDVFGDGPVGDDWLGGMPSRDVVLDSSKLDDSGMGLSRTCPAVLTNSTSFSFFGYQYTLKFEMFCAMLELVGQLLVVLAAFVGVRILLKSATG